MQHSWVMIVALCAACGGEPNEVATEPELPATPTIVESELIAEECVDELIDTLLWRRDPRAAGCSPDRYAESR